MGDSTATDWGDEIARETCAAFARCAADAIVATGQALDFLAPDDSVRGLSVVTSMGGDLATGTCALLDSGKAP